MAHLLRLIFALALYVGATSDAFAQSVHVTQGEASAACADWKAWADEASGSHLPGGATAHCVHYSGTRPEWVTAEVAGYYRGHMTWNTSGEVVAHVAPVYFAYTASNPCADLQGEYYEAWNHVVSWPPPTSGCSSGSECAISMDVLSQPYAVGGGIIAYRMGASYTGESCTIEEPTDEGSEEDAGDGWKCDPQTGLCTDPDGNGKLCTFNPDGTRSACVDYTPGDSTDPAPQDEEQPDDPRDKQTVSGGAGCTQAPACTSSNPIECAMLWQQWKTRCALEKEGSVSNAACVNGVPTTLNCTNMDAAQCFALQKQHETSCFLSVSGTSYDGQLIEPGDMGSASDFGDSAYAAGAGTAEGSSGAWRPAPGAGDGPEFDDSGWLSGRSCPILPVVTTSIMGNPISLDFNSPDLCWWLSLGSQLVLVFAALASIRIYSKVI